MLNSKSSENFAPTKIGRVLAVLGSGGQGFQKFRFLLQRHICA